MSWHFLQAGEEASWEVDCLDGAPSALLKLIPTAEESCSLDSGTDALNLSPFGMMSELSTDIRGEGASMSSQAVSPARILLWEVRRKQDLMANGADSGPKWQESFAKLDPDSFSWKTPQLSFIEGLDEFCETWPQWGMMRAGECFPLPMLAHDTSVRGCLSFPTVTASWAGRGPGLSNNLDNLRMSEKCTRNTLATISEFGWKWPATLCEWMMGWPIKWTALAPLETAKFQQWLASHGKF